MRLAAIEESYIAAQVVEVGSTAVLSVCLLRAVAESVLGIRKAVTSCVTCCL